MQAIKTLFNLTCLTLLVVLYFFLNVDKAAAETVLYGVARSNDGTSVLYQVEPSTGEATKVGAPETTIGFKDCSGMDFDPSWKLYAICVGADGTYVLITIDLDTGEGLMVNSTGIASRYDALDIGSDISFRNSDGTLFGYFLDSGFRDFLGTIDLSTGDVSEVGASSLVELGNGLAFSKSYEMLHAGSRILPPVGPGLPARFLGAKLRILDQVANAEGSIGSNPVVDLTFPSSAEGPTLSVPRINAMDFEPRTGMLFALLNDGGSESYLGIVNLKTGQVTIIGQSQDNLDAMAFIPVPEVTEPPVTSEPPAFSGAPYLKCNKVIRGRYIGKHEEVEVILDNGSESVKVRVMNPVSLCTVLYDDGQVLTESTTTLACYKVKDVVRHRRSKHHQLSFEWHQVYLENEVGEQIVSVDNHQTLCVPSVIKDDKVKIKIRYHSRHKNLHKKHKRLHKKLNRVHSSHHHSHKKGAHSRKHHSKDDG